MTAELTTQNINRELGLPEEFVFLVEIFVTGNALSVFVEDGLTWLTDHENLVV
jgi:hypothetical protein